MATDALMLGVLSRVCRGDLQMFEKVQVVHEGAEGYNCYLCLGKHTIFFVHPQLDGLMESEDELPYLGIEKAVTDTSTSRFFLLELADEPEAAFNKGRAERILVESLHREALLERIALCWQAEYMYQRFQVKKFPHAQATIGAQLPGLAGRLYQTNTDHLQVMPFKGYTSSNGKHEFKHRGYTFFLRDAFKSPTGLKNGTFVHEEGWEAEYNAQKVVVPPGVEITIHVVDPVEVMLVEKDSSGADDLRTLAAEYKQALTQNLSQFYVTANGPYCKRMNRTNDVASWDGWEFFVRSREHAYACVVLRRQYIPPLCDTAQDLAVLLRCPAQGITQDACEVILDECRFVADTISSTSTPKPYAEIIQARLDTLQFTEEGYRWAEGQLGLSPCHKRPAAAQFVKSIARVLVVEGFVEESLGEAEVFADIPHLVEPMKVAQEMLSDAEGLLGGEGPDEEGVTRTERRNAWYWRVARYLAYCVDGGIMDDRFTMSTMLQAIGRSSAENDRVLKSVVEFLLHARPRGDWKRSFNQVNIPLSQLLQQPEEFDRFSFNDRVMRLLLTEKYIENEWKKKSAGREGAGSYEQLLATLLTSENAGLGLRTLICRQILENTNVGETENQDENVRGVNVLVPALINVMQGGNLSLASCATAALVNLSCGKMGTKTMLVCEGVMKIAVLQLKAKDDDLTLYTLFLLVNLTKTPDHRSIVVRYGGIPVLVDILTSAYQNLRKERIITEICSVIGQLCNDAETRTTLSDDFPVLLCLLWIYDSSPPNTKLKAKVLFALRQLCQIGQNKIKVGQHVITRVIDEIAQVVPGKFSECLMNSVLLLLSLSSVHSNARRMDYNGRLEEAFEACLLQIKGQENKKHKFGTLIWERVLKLKERITEAKYAGGGS